MMGDSDGVLLNHYNLSTLYPAEWPAEKDEGDTSEEELGITKQTSRSKYTTLERGPSLRNSVPGSQRNKDGVETLVQKDEADPLGGAESVVQVLREHGLPVQDNMRLREH